MFDVACGGGAAVNAETQRCPENNAAVDVATCATQADTGADELRAVWRDPTYVAGESAAYYARGLENPTCRWSSWDALRAGSLQPDAASNHTERVWSSPIWLENQLMKQALFWRSALITDRFVWFLVIGLLLFCLDRWRQDADDYHIIVDLPLLEKLAAQWQGQTQRLPDANELDALVEGYVREEILVREARRLNLDQDDVIIRRRLAQKYEFFLADADVPTEPDLDTLGAFFEVNRTRYRLPETVSIMFFSTMKTRQALPSHS